MNIEEGEYINLGRVLFAIVDEKAWVEANLKETQLTHVKVGQSVTFIPDTFSKNMWNGNVESISPLNREFSTFLLRIRQEIGLKLYKEFL